MTQNFIAVLWVKKVVIADHYSNKILLKLGIFMKHAHDSMNMLEEELSSDSSGALDDLDDAEEGDEDKEDAGSESDIEDFE